MDPQTPAEGIVQLKGGNLWKYYRVPCECGCDAEVDIMIEIDDPEDDLITCHISSKVKTAWWRETFPITYDEPWVVMWLKETANRAITTANICWTAITKGYVEVESYTLLTKQQALNMSAVLQDGIAQIEEEQVKRSAKKKQDAA